MAFYIKRNDTSPALLATLQDADGNVVNIEDASVRFHMRRIGGASVKIDEAATIASAAGGLVRYDWTSSDTDTAGTYRAEIEVTYSDATVETFPNDGYIIVEIIDDIA